MRNLTLSLRQKRQGKSDAEVLRAKHPMFADYDAHAQRVWDMLRPHYHEYITGVSTSAMAVSIHSARVLYMLCEATKPETALDLGSGFSSFILRMYARDCGHAMTVYSVDDHGDWLQATRDYLENQNVSNEHCYELSDFKAADTPKFDLTFHDMGNMATRTRELGMALDGASDRGVVLVDDMHDRRYGRYASGLAQDKGMTVLSMREFTLDDIGRFSGLVVPESVTLSI